LGKQFFEKEAKSPKMRHYAEIKF